MAFAVLIYGKCYEESDLFEEAGHNWPSDYKFDPITGKELLPKVCKLDSNFQWGNASIYDGALVAAYDKSEGTVFIGFQICEVSSRWPNTEVVPMSEEEKNGIAKLLKVDKKDLSQFLVFVDDEVENCSTNSSCFG
jgi:hypothetical protein